MARKKNSKPKDRFDEILGAISVLDRKTGLQHDDLKHQIGLVSEQVADNNLELITLSRRVAVLEKRMVNRK